MTMNQSCFLFLVFFFPPLVLLLLDSWKFASHAVTRSGQSVSHVHDSFPCSIPFRSVPFHSIPPFLLFPSLPSSLPFIMSSAARPWYGPQVCTVASAHSHPLIHLPYGRVYESGHGWKCNICKKTEKAKNVRSYACFPCSKQTSKETNRAQSADRSLRSSQLPLSVSLCPQSSMRTRLASASREMRSFQL